MPDGGCDTSSPLRAPLLSSSPEAELIGVDEMLHRFAGEFGKWQLRHFLLTSLAWSLTAFHTLVVVFADRKPGTGPTEPTRYFDSTVAEWGLVGGEKYKVGLSQSAFFAGSMIGAGIFGHLSDSFLGRKGAVTLTSSINAVSGLATAFSPAFPFYAALRFVTGLSTGGLGVSVFTLTTEPVGSSARSPVAMCTFLFFALGSILLSLASLSTPSWRSLYIISSVPSVIFVIVVVPFIAESPRWHLVHGDVTAAMATMRSIAKTNGKDLPDNVFLALDDRKAAQENKKDAARSTIIDVIRSPVTGPRLALSVVINFVISIAYYGLTLNVKNLGTDLHISVMLNAAAEMPAYALTALLVKWCGRRKMMVSMTWAAAAFCVAAACFAETARTACAVMGVFAVTGTFNLLYIYTAELFPTTVRNAALGVVLQAGQTGAIVAPMVVVLGRDRPFWVFGVCGAVGGLLGLLSPETVDRPLYETMEGLERGEEGGLNGEKREKESFV